MGILTQRRGRTQRSPWAQSRYSPGVLAPRPGRTGPAPWAYSPSDDRTTRVPTRTLLHRGRRRARQSPTTDTTGANVHAQHNRCSRHRLNHRTRTEQRPEPKAHAERAVSTGTAAPWTRSGLTTEGSTPVPGPTQRSPWAVPVARRGRTQQTQRAYLHRAMGRVTVRAGHTSPAPWAYTAHTRTFNHGAALAPRPGRTQRARWAYSARDDRTPRVPTARTLRHRRRRGPRQSPTTDTTGANVHAQHNRCSRHRLNHRTRTEQRPEPKAHAERAVSTGTAAPWTRSGLTTERSTPVPGPTQRSPWAYRSRAVGVLSKRRGRTYTAPWVESGYAPGILVLCHD